jgi:hypothetical protein
MGETASPPGDRSPAHRHRPVNRSQEHCVGEEMPRWSQRRRDAGRLFRLRNRCTLQDVLHNLLRPDAADPQFRLE